MDQTRLDLNSRPLANCSSMGTEEKIDYLLEDYQILNVLFFIDELGVGFCFPIVPWLAENNKS